MAGQGRKDSMGEIFRYDDHTKLRFIELPNRNGLKMRGLLHIPEDTSEENKVPAALVLHGFMGHRIGTAFSNAHLSKAIADVGIANLRLDFIGSGESDGNYEDMSILTELDEAEIQLEFLKSLPFVDSDRIAVFGHSQGGLIAGLLGGKHPEEIRCIALSSPGFNIGEDWKKGILNGLDPEKLKRKGWIDIKGYKIGYRYYKDALDTPTYEIASRYHGPVQIVHGTADKIVPIEYGRRLKEVYGEKCTMIEVEGADHDYSSVAFADARIRHTVDFLKEHLF